LSADIQELGFRPVCTDDLDPDGKSVLRCAERHDKHWMAARVERLKVGAAVLVVRPQYAIEVERCADIAALERRTKGDGREQDIVASKEALEILDPHTFDAERRSILLR